MRIVAAAFVLPMISARYLAQTPSQINPVAPERKKQA